MLTSVATIPGMAKTQQIEPWQLEDAQRLKTLFKERSTLTQAEFGAKYGIGNQGYVWQLMNGRRPLNFDVVQKFAGGLGVTIDEISPRLAQQVANASGLLSLDPDDDEFIAIRRIDVRLSAGRGELVTSEDEKDRLSFRADFLRAAGANPSNTYSVSVKGTSMEPLLPDGSVILINRGSTTIINGKIFAFRLNGELLVKRLYKDADGFTARSENPEYQDIRVGPGDDDFEIIGRAFWVGSKL